MGRGAWPSTVLCSWLLIMGCRRQPATPAESAPPVAPVQQHEPRVIVTTEEAISTADLLSRAERALERAEFEAAARDFELLLAVPHEPAEEARIRLGYAQALEGTGQLERAASELELRIPLTSDADAARFELLSRLLLLQRFTEAGALAQAVDRARASASDRILVEAALALALLASAEPSRADAVLARAWALLDEAGDRERRPLRQSAAWVSFAAGELARAAARRVDFDPVPDDVALVLEARCRPMVDAQSAYAEAMRLESGRLRLIAGERIAGLYLELHRDILAAPLPDALAEVGKRPLAEGALLLRYEVLLEKAEQMLRITLGGTPDTPAARPVRQQVEAALAQVVTKRAAHAAEVDRLPVQRSDLSRILDALGAPSTAPAAGPAPVHEPPRGPDAAPRTPP